MKYLHAEFSAEIERGCTYPMEEAMVFEKFREYWFGTFAVVVLRGDREEVTRLISSKGEEEADWEGICLGTFYIKPNYPGNIHIHASTLPRCLAFKVFFF